MNEVQSVRSGSDFWADGRSRTPSSHAFTASGSHYRTSDFSHESDKQHHPHPHQQNSGGRSHTRQGQGTNESSQYMSDDYEHDEDSQRTERGADVDDGVVDEVGAQDAFIAGMIYALSRRICPGSPYTPSWNGEEDSSSNNESGRWRLDECLRFVAYS